MKEPNEIVEDGYFKIDTECYLTLPHNDIVPISQT